MTDCLIIIIGAVAMVQTDKMVEPPPAASLPVFFPHYISPSSPNKIKCDGKKVREMARHKKRGTGRGKREGCAA